MQYVRTYAGDREWLNARGKKSLRSARWHLCSLSLASLLLRLLALSNVTVQRSLPIISTSILYCTTIFTIISASCTTIFTKRFRSTYIYLHTLAQIRPPMLQDYSPHAKALGNHYLCQSLSIIIHHYNPSLSIIYNHPPLIQKWIIRGGSRTHGGGGGGGGG